MTAGKFAIAATLVALLALGCAARFNGDVTYDADAPWSSYKTVAWVEGQGSSTETVRSLAESEVKKQLEGAGLTFADGNSADLLVRVNLGKRRRNALSGGIGSQAEMVGLEVVISDRKSGDRIWNGWAAKTYSSDLEAKTEVPEAIGYIVDIAPQLR